MTTRRKRYWQFPNGTLAKTTLGDVAFIRRYFTAYEAWDRQLGAFVYYDGGSK